MNPVELLREMSVTALSIGDPRFRRTLSNAGYKSILDAFATSEGELDSSVGYKTSDMVLKLKEEFEANPEAFAIKATTKREVDEVAVQKDINRLMRQQNSINAPNIHHASSGHAKSNSVYIPPMPKEPQGDTLLYFENQTEKVFDNLADRRATYFAFEAFDEFETELPQLEECFHWLFKRYQGQLNDALSISINRVPNAFILFCSYQAKSVFDGENLWGQLFEKFGIHNQGYQVNFKKAFLGCLKSRQMPIYLEQETEFRYMYTALMHGGLSLDAWENLWEKSLIPMANKSNTDPFGFGMDFDARKALMYMRDTERPYSPKKSVLSLLDKAPEEIVLPLINSALSIARKLVNPAQAKQAGMTMLSRTGLPDTALIALNNTRGNTKSHYSKKKGKPSENSPLVYLHEGKLQLDMDKGRVFIKWKRQVLPETLIGYVVEYYVNGILRYSTSILEELGHGVLDAVEIEVNPHPKYEITIKLSHKLPDGTTAEDDSLEQSFQRFKPGCLEFLETPSGDFYLRESKDRISRKRVIAYLLRKGLKIVPGMGMRLIERHEGFSSISETTIEFFEVSPGSCGSIVDESSGEELAAWQENLRITVNRNRIIGRNVNGLDLYGVVKTETKGNRALPTITIEAVDGNLSPDDYETECYCDSKRIDLCSQIIWSGDDLNQVSAITIPISKEVYFPWHACRCDVIVHKKPTDTIVFRYSFSVVPITDLSIESIDPNNYMTTYSFRAARAMTVSFGEESTVVTEGKKYNLLAPLSETQIRIHIESVQSDRYIVSEVNLGKR
ncbi:MAG: hypothetical protein IJ125_02750 [Atopobiaceae bacterium]|nr:hypothetical protein [Atopobiaceae bacterium]